MLENRCESLLLAYSSSTEDAKKRIQNSRLWGELDEAIDALSIKAHDLSSRGFREYALIAQELAANLREKSNQYFGEIAEGKKPDLENFKNNCISLINDKKPILSHHRGWKQTFANLLQIVTIIGSIGGIVNLMTTGKFSLFSVKTDSQKKLEKIESQVNSIGRAKCINSQ
jgi:hypothetical protein